MNAETAGHVGTAQLKQFHMVYIDMWHHPKYYKELRKLRNKLDQAISNSNSTAWDYRRTFWSGPQATSCKRQASSSKRLEQQAASFKRQATSFKLQAASFKLQDLITTKKFHGTRTEVLDQDKTVLRMLHVEANLMGR